jgi:hypothetical protein
LHEGRQCKNLRDVDHNIHSYDESGRGRAERIGRNTIAQDGDARAKIWLRAYFNYIIWGAGLGYRMKIEPGKLIQFIVCQATEFGTSLSPIRVVKFLYLADLYHARENKGETLPGWPWAFV